MGANVAFIGLGVMGYPMAGHLAANGHAVTVWNRTAAKAEAWAKEHKGKAAASPREAAEGAEFVFSCVGNDDDLRSVCYGDDGILAGLAKGAVLIDMTSGIQAIVKTPEGFVGGADGRREGAISPILRAPPHGRLRAAQPVPRVRLR